MNKRLNELLNNDDSTSTTDVKNQLKQGRLYNIVNIYNCNAKRIVKNKYKIDLFNYLSIADFFLFINPYKNISNHLIVNILV